MDGVRSAPLRLPSRQKMIRTTGPRYTPFALSVAQRDEKLTLVLVGELDLESAEKLLHAVSELRLPETKETELDLRRVDFLDSSGLRALLALRNDAKRNRDALVLIPPAPNVRRIFEITGTWGLFDWRGDRPSPEPPDRASGVD